MTHPVGCERAKLHQCQCSDCGGTKHGWPYSVTLAGDPSPAGRQEARDRSNSAWAATQPPKGRRSPSKRRQAAATDSATVDLIDWLSENPSTIKQIQKVGNLLTGSVISELDKGFGGSKPREARRSLADHFWCDLLVALAEGIEEFSKAMDRIPEYVTAVIIKSRNDEPRSPLLEALVALAAQTA